MLQSALTHSEPTGRDSLQVTWSATNASGQVQLVATVVEDYRSWWQDVKSQPFAVTGKQLIRAAQLQVSYIRTDMDVSHIHTQQPLADVACRYLIFMYLLSLKINILLVFILRVE